MKKKWLIIISVVLLWPIINITVGNAASQTVGMNISVVEGPTLSLTSPENETYLTNESLLLNYSANNEESVWYNLDNSANTTITSSVYFNTSQGSHTLYLYANNSLGNINSTNITFFINSTSLTIIDNEYGTGTGGHAQRKKKKGQSTDFFNYTYEEIQNLSNIILHIPEYGKILFNQAINLTNDENFTDYTLDLDSHTNISLNRTFLNSTALPNFNISASIWLYNLTFSDPRILMDGEICPSTICTEESYSSGTGTLKFNVTSFSVYSAEETPEDEVEDEVPAAPGGGGGSAVVPKKLKFEVEPELIKITIKKGEIFKSSLKIKNTEDTTQNFKIETIALEDFIIIKESEFSLAPKEEKVILLIFSSPEDSKEDTYTGKIKISTSEEEKEIPIVLGIQSKITLFGITINIPSEYKDIQPGEELKFQVSLFNLGEIEKAEVKLTYYIKDFEGKIIIEQQETITIENQVSFSRTIKLPEVTGGQKGTGAAIIHPGPQYALVANVMYASSVGTASDIFYVNRIEVDIINRNLLIAVIFIVIAIIASTMLIISNLNKKIKKTSKVYKKELRRAEDRMKKGHLKSAEAAKIEERLKLQLRSLENSYKKGFITETAYQNGKSKIQKAISKLKRNIYK